MVFVTVGSQKFPFDRLIKKVDQMIRDHIIEGEVFIQTGASDYIPCSRHQAFCERKLFTELMDSCDILITHGGAGTMVDAVRRGKKTIVVPRLSQYGEHVDDHQLELTEQFHEMNLVYACPDVSLLPQAMQSVRERSFNTFPSNTEMFIKSLDSFIGTL